MIFSFPLNKEAWDNNLLTIDWLKNHRSLIHDVYTTLDILECAEMNGSKTTANIKDILTLKKNNISVNIIINNVFNPPNIDLVLKRLTPLRGIIDSVTVPNHKWIQPFKDLGFHVKSTVIHVPTIDDISNGLYDSYDTIYIHDEIIHNHDKWLNIKGDRRLGLVSNFGECLGWCRSKRTHYKAISNGDHSFDYDHSVKCPAQRLSKPLLNLMRCAIPTSYAEYMYYSDVVDIFKLQGRSQIPFLKHAMSMLECFKSKQDYIQQLPDNYEEWAVKVRNCGGQCSKCNWCERWYSNNL